MEWDSHNIRSLRRRLGWSQSDLARRLQIESASVQTWESGEAKPLRSQVQILEMLFNQAELTSLEIAQSTQVELTMNQRELESLSIQSLDSSENE